MSVIDLFSEQKASLRPLYDHQKEALRKYDDARLEGHTRVMLQAPTGFGKTLTSIHLIAMLIALGKRVCFTVPRLTLIDKTVRDFGAEGLEFGVIQGDHPLTDPTLPLQIASIQTLERRIQLLDKKKKALDSPESQIRFDVFIFDEAHILHKGMVRLMSDFPNSAFIGLSATPWTKGLGRLYSKLVIASTISKLIESGYLSKFVVYAPTPEPNLKGVKTTAGDYNQAQHAEAVNTTKLVGDIVETWLKRGEDRQTLCFCVDRAHAKHVQERFVEAGVLAEYVDCETTDIDRRAIIDRFHRGETRIICNVGVLTTGFDSDVRCIILARPIGIVARSMQATYGFHNDDRGHFIQPGRPIEILVDGDLYVGNSGAPSAAPGLKAYASNVDGRVSFFAAGSVNSGFVETNFWACSAGATSELVLISTTKPE